MAEAARRINLWAMSSAVLAVVMIAVYVAITHSQGNDALAWVIAILAVGAAAAAYGAWSGAPHGRLALAVAGSLLVALGLVAILSIGLLIMLAGVLALLAFARAPRRAD